MKLKKVLVTHCVSWSIQFNGFNPIPDKPILGFFNTAANKDKMSKLLTNGHTVF